MAREITYEDLQKANALIQTTPVKGKDYAEVPQRVKAFRSLYPQGTISTEIVKIENGMCVIHAVAAVDGVVLGEGTAYEMEGSSFINKTSYIENCETSAVGRALGFAGFGIDTSIASYEEVSNAIEQQKTDDDKRAEIKRLIQETNTDTKKFLYSMGAKFKRELGAVDEMKGKELDFALKKMREKQKESEGK